MREDDNVTVVVNIHFIDTEVEGVARPKGDRSDGVMASQWATKHVTNACAFAWFEVQPHLVETASEFHFVWDVVVDFEQLSVAV